MNKYHRSSLQLILIISITLIVAVYGMNLEIGYGIILLFITVGSTLFLNFKSARENKDEQ